MPIVLQSVVNSNPDPLTDIERTLVSRLRVLLNDLPAETVRTLNSLVEDGYGQRWNDVQLLVYINQALNELNSEPPITGYDLATVPWGWYGCILNGGIIYALISESILMNGEQFSYSDNGISLQVNLTQGYQSIAQMILTGYRQQVLNIKRSMRPFATAVIDGAPPARIRSYAPRMWVYR